MINYTFKYQSIYILFVTALLFIINACSSINEPNKLSDNILQLEKQISSQIASGKNIDPPKIKKLFLYYWDNKCYKSAYSLILRLADSKINTPLDRLIKYYSLSFKASQLLKKNKEKDEIYKILEGLENLRKDTLNEIDLISVMALLKSAEIYYYEKRYQDCLDLLDDNYYKIMTINNSRNISPLNIIVEADYLIVASRFQEALVTHTKEDYKTAYDGLTSYLMRGETYKADKVYKMYKKCLKYINNDQSVELIHRALEKEEPAKWVDNENELKKKLTPLWIYFTRGIVFNGFIFGKDKTIDIEIKKLAQEECGKGLEKTRKEDFEGAIIHFKKVIHLYQNHRLHGLKNQEQENIVPLTNSLTYLTVVYDRLGDNLKRKRILRNSQFKR